jgi:predicted dehydrogenase
MINLGIVGMGYIGHVHREACRKISGAQVVVATREPEKIRSTFRGEIYPHYEELLQDNRLDAVIIGLPTDLHEKAVVMAAECGRHILCEKSMALNAASARGMIAAAQARERILMVAHVLRFWAQYARIKEMIHAGEIGSPISVTANRLSKFPPWTNWFRNAERSGGTLLDLQVHDVDVVHWILGHPRSVYTVGIESNSGCWDHIHTILTYPDAQASIEASSMMPESFPSAAAFLFWGRRGRWNIRSGWAPIFRGVHQPRTSSICTSTTAASASPRPRRRTHTSPSSVTLWNGLPTASRPASGRRKSLARSYR